MITSKLTSKAQTTIPQAVRLALALSEGDELVYAIEGERVVLSKAPARPARARSDEDPFAAFDEWQSDADSRAFGKL